MHWLFLIGAIAFELIGTTLMKISYGFTKLVPTIGTFVAYAICFTLLSFSLKKIEVGIAYAIWSAVGIVVISGIGIVLFKESISAIKIGSIVLVLLGVVGLYLSN